MNEGKGSRENFRKINTNTRDQTKTEDKICRAVKRKETKEMRVYKRQG